jgi:hypothetical protein
MLIRGDGYRHTTRSGRKYSKYGKASGMKSKRSSGIPRPIRTQGDLLWEVEEVIASRMGCFGREYLVKWRGFSARENSWTTDLPPYFQKIQKWSVKRELEPDSDDGSPSCSSCSASDQSESDSDSEESDSEPDEAFATIMKDFAEADTPPSATKLDKRTQLAVKAMMALATAMEYKNDTESDSD